jgi:hypothetical protein
MSEAIMTIAAPSSLFPFKTAVHDQDLEFDPFMNVKSVHDRDCRFKLRSTMLIECAVASSTSST